jgi:molecular chaperone DnaK
MRNEPIVGIDLGTTNSEVAAYVADRVEVLGPAERRILPSVVGFSPDGRLLVGNVARNQHLLYPDRTVRSVKRQMGKDDPIVLGEQSFTPQEVSAILLRTLRMQAQQALGTPVKRAVITVPAFFSDAQRQATRRAGELAGLEVVRIINEPTAASLAYGYGQTSTATVMVYDLGGGTFDVSIVNIEEGITEVLASHGDSALGGDDFDRALLDVLLCELKAQHGIDLRRGHAPALARLDRAVEQAKIRLSSETRTQIVEESLVVYQGRPIHIERELTREEYEALIAPMLDRTLKSVKKALEDAGKDKSELDAVLLVGGSTRTPLVSKLLTERVGQVPRKDVHPDLCVALGAGLLASRLSGDQARSQVLVDISPYSFGPSFLGERDGINYPHCYEPIIERNTPLPATRTKPYYTATPFQETVQIDLYQGEDPDALKNILVGTYRFEGLEPVEGPNEVLCEMTLDLDGILRVEHVEKVTGKSKSVTIRDTFDASRYGDLDEGQKRIAGLFDDDELEQGNGAFVIEQDDDNVVDLKPWLIAAGGSPRAAGQAGRGPLSERDKYSDDEANNNQADVVENAASQGADWTQRGATAWQLVERSRGLLPSLHQQDQQEAEELHEAIAEAIEARDVAALDETVKALEEFLFFVEGQ